MCGSNLKKRSITFGPDSSLLKTRSKIAAMTTLFQYFVAIVRTSESLTPSTAAAFCTLQIWHTSYRSTAQWKAPVRPRQLGGNLLPSSSPPDGQKGCTLTGHLIIISWTKNSSPSRDTKLSLTTCSTNPVRYMQHRILNQHIA